MLNSNNDDAKNNEKNKYSLLCKNFLTFTIIIFLVGFLVEALNSVDALHVVHTFP